MDAKTILNRRGRCRLRTGFSMDNPTQTPPFFAYASSSAGFSESGITHVGTPQQTATRASLSEDGRLPNGQNPKTYKMARVLSASP